MSAAPVHERRCGSSGALFPVTARDLAFYERVSPRFGSAVVPIPLPTLSAPERLRRRLSWRNERTLHRRTCDLCGQSCIAIYPSETPFPVYCPNCWWGDGWTPPTQTFDPTLSFFAQLEKLQERVPRISLIHLGEIENSDFTNDVMRLKDCYLVFDSEQARNCSYGETFYSLNDCLDFLDLCLSERCYECVACEECYRLRHSLACFQCSDSWFLRDCRGCRNCFACANLERKEHYVFNEQLSKAAYDDFLRSFCSDRAAAVEDRRAEAHRFWQSVAVRYMRGNLNEGVSGDYISFSKDSAECFNSRNLRHRRRLALRNPRRLYNRSCAHCRAQIESTYAPDRPEIVVCAECYQKARI